MFVDRSLASTTQLKENASTRMLFFLVLVVITLQASNYLSNSEKIAANILHMDYDGYWHLLRAKEIHYTGIWNNNVNYRGNAPFGERIHWTHAMDLVLLAGGNAGALFSDFDTGLRWFGVVVGPFFYMLTLLVIIILARSLLDEKKWIYLSFLFALNPFLVSNVYSVNRPDHHCLVSFVYVIYFYSFSLLLKQFGKHLLGVCLLGAAGAVGLWTGLEMLTLIVLSILFLGMLWIFFGRFFLMQNFILSISLSFFLCLILLAENGLDNFALVAFDRISVFHLFVFSTISGYWFVALFFSGKNFFETPVSRFLFAFGGFVCLISLWLYFFPGIMDGPFKGVDPMVKSLYLRQTGEFGKNSKMMLHNFLLALPAVAFVSYRLLMKKDRENNLLYTWLILAVLVYFVLGLYMTRWVFTLSIVCLLPNAMILGSIADWKKSRINCIIAFSLVFCLLILPLSVIIVPKENNIKDTQRSDYNFVLIDTLKYITTHTKASAGDIILANIYIGPAILYYTPFNVVGTPNHNNSRGILDTYEIVTSRSDTTAWSHIQKRGIKYILVDKRLNDFAWLNSGRTKDQEDNAGKLFFINRLKNDKRPDWVYKIPLPKKLEEEFKFYGILSQTRPRPDDMRKMVY